MLELRCVRDRGGWCCLLRAPCSAVRGLQDCGVCRSEEFDGLDGFYGVGAGYVEFGGKGPISQSGWRIVWTGGGWVGCRCLR